MARGRCRAAALLLVDDNSYLEALAREGHKLPWHPSVRPLLASPAHLNRRRRARELRVAVAPFCPACGSPRVAAYLWGTPTAELEDAAQRSEVIIGGCEIHGGGLDPAFACLDCHALESNPARDALAAQRPAFDGLLGSPAVSAGV